MFQASASLISNGGSGFRSVGMHSEPSMIGHSSGSNSTDSDSKDLKWVKPNHYGSSVFYNGGTTLDLFQDRKHHWHFSAGHGSVT